LSSFYSKILASAQLFPCNLLTLFQRSSWSWKDSNRGGNIGDEGNAPLRCPSIHDYVMFSADCEQVCAGDLGNDAEHLEHNLSEITSLAYKWKAVILLDEADVYLEQRSLQDIGRNGLVSVFLRHLEYFQGIMFLTTNRVTTFDDAFRSRIHFAMKFGELSTQAKTKIWNAFLAKVPTTEKKIKDTEMDSLSSKNINGRQVRLHPK